MSREPGQEPSGAPHRSMLAARSAASAALHGGLAVAAGAFGAHGLKARLGSDALGWWHTAAQYHLAHAIVLLVVALYALRLATPLPRALTAALVALQVGIVLFSGSLYVMAVTDVRALGAVTPFGGVAFLVAWAALAWHLWRAAAKT